MFYTVGSCWLSILNIAECTCPSQAPYLSFPLIHPPLLRPGNLSYISPLFDLTSLSMTISRCIHVAANAIISRIPACVLAITVVSDSWRPYGLYSPPGSSVHGILQARILEWVAIPFSRGCSRPRYGTRISYISCFGRLVLYHWCHLRIVIF